MTTEEKYWFARGYYDGRQYGYMNDQASVNQCSEGARLAYKQGYDLGLCDFCDEIDAANEEADKFIEEIEKKLGRKI